MTIYTIYVKTHKITGLKYLGFTTKQDPHKYHGSGKFWKRHLAKHGYDYNTEIIRECHSNEEVKEWGSYYSNLWNIVESHEWANLKPETGSGAPSGSAHHMADFVVHQKAVNTRKERGNYNRSITAIKKGQDTKLLRYGTLNSSTTESTAKIVGTRMRNGNWAQSSTPETIAKQLETKRRNGTTNSNTIDSIARGLITKQLNNTSANSPNVIAKAIKTRMLNGTLNTSTPEAIAARVATRRKNILAGTDGVVLKVSCPHCGKEGGQSIMKRWHFNKCKSLNI